MISFKPTYLYVKTHNITGLKYFGKTVKDPIKYKGSGKRWINHIQKHGYDVTTEIVGYYTDRCECENAALQFSKQNNIVESIEWANLCLENGSDGGARINNNFTVWSKLPKSVETKKKISQSLKGKKNKSIPVTVKGTYFDSMADAARHFGVVEQSIYYWIKIGKGKKHK